MKESGKYKLPEKFPCVEIIAKDKKEAAEAILSQSTNYGKITDKGLVNFIDEYDLRQIFPELRLDLEIQELNLDQFNINYFNVSNKDNEIPEISKNVKIKLGDLYQLGRHRLLCGDATNSDDVNRLMNKQKAEMLFTDPPYGVNYSAKNEFLNKWDKGNRNQRNIENDNNLQNIENSFVNAKNILAEYSSYYIFSAGGGELMMMMMMMMANAGLPHRHMIIWVKNNHVLGRTDYNYKHEPIHYGWVKKHKFYGNGQQKFSVWNYNKPLKSSLHPTMKPVDLIVNAILNSTLNQNSIVVDLFLGSGSTLIACEKTQRICYGLEIDPVYCDTIIKRWENYTSNKAIKLK